MKDEATTISVPLTVEERAERADIMAGLVGQISAIKDQAKKAAAEFREEVEALIESLEAHARVLRAGEESRDQMHLTFPQEQAAKASHDVAKAACTCIDPEVKDIDCVLHGADSDGGQEGSVIPDGGEVEVGSAEEPRAVADFHAAKERRTAEA